MPRRRKVSSEPLSPNLTPLLDVVLQLITFFMMLIHFGTRIEGATRAVKLPVTPAALPEGDLAIDRLTVVIDDKGELVVGDQALEGAAAEKWWEERANERKGGLETLNGVLAEELPTVVIVRADKRASYGAVRRTLATAQGKGFAHFSLVVLRNLPR